MLRVSALDETINLYYDDEINSSELLNLEARIANSDVVKDYTYEKCFEYFKISNSIKLIKSRTDKHAKNVVDNFFKSEKKKRRLNRHLFHFFSMFR